jgi:two-component system response regulator AtoC
MRLGGGQRSLSPEGMKALLKYPWPGNVREMENMFERAAILADSTVLTLEDILPLLADSEIGEEESLPPDELSIKTASRHLERKLIIKALKKTQYNRSQAARLLEISHRALLYKIKDYDIEVPK